MKKKLFFAAIESFTIAPKPAPKRHELLLTLKKIEKENETTDISSHFWAAGNYIRSAIETGLSQ